MTKKKLKKESDAEQIDRFEKEVQKLEDAGDLNRTDAENVLSRLLSSGARKSKPEVSE